MEISTDILRFTKRIGELASNLPGMFVPMTCLTCDAFVEKQGGCCAKCWGELRFISEPMCPVYGTPFSVDMGDGVLSTDAIANPPPFERLRAVMLYDELARKMVSTIKYSDRTDLIPWISNWMKVAGKALLKETDIVVPVPLHKSRLRMRRFNQAGEIARRVCGDKNLFRPEVLLRRKPTKQQVGLTEKERERNMSGAFVVPEEMKLHVKGKRILLVDDVYTTGSTVKAATRALKRGGASNIDVLVFAKVETYLV